MSRSRAERRAATRSTLARFTAQATKSFAGLQRQTDDAMAVARAMSSGTYTLLEWARDSVALTTNASALLLGCDSLPLAKQAILSFDGAAEMAGPLTIAAPTTVFTSATASRLELVGGAAPTIIDASKVRVRISATALVITLVDLFDLQPKLLPGRYHGTITLLARGGKVVDTVAIAAQRN